MAKIIEHHLQPASSEWLNAPALRSVFLMLGGGEEVRVVGGAIRNSLLHESIGDIDLACVHSADEIMRRAERAGIKAVATGGVHGTVSLIIFEGKKNHVFEVTPLRIDIETDGRHATVAPTQNWALDAQRRDFSINALYCDETGQIYDYIDAYDDVLARRVRFIGSASQRIEEDYLRILRFFRFAATYAKGVLDSDGLAACIARQDGLCQLSAERVKQELFKLLVAPFASKVIHQVVENQIMGKVLPGVVCIECFDNLVDIERTLNMPAQCLPRLAALAAGDARQMETWSESLKLSNKESAYLIEMGRHVGAFSCDLEDAAQKVLLYRLGENIFRQCAVLAWCLASENADVPGWKKLIALPQRWQVPVFPLSGADVMAQGVATGPRIGEILSRLEQDWIEAGFKWDAAELAMRLKTVVDNN